MTISDWLEMIISDWLEMISDWLEEIIISDWLEDIIISDWLLLITHLDIATGSRTLSFVARIIFIDIHEKVVIF